MNGIMGMTELALDSGAADVQQDLPQGLRVLLAEDNEVKQKFAIRALTKAGHSVEVAGNGQQAVEAWAGQSFDVVLMDIQMPVMDGYLATAEIRQREASSNRHTPIIAMTAHAMKGDKEKCLEAGMEGYVTKPIKSKLMLAEISRVLEKFPRQNDSGLREEQMDVRVIVSVSPQRESDSSASRLSDELDQTLSQHRIVVPSLAERKEDIAVIADHIVDRLARSAGKALDALSSDAQEMLRGYSWPGNIRELQSVAERAVLFASGTQVAIPGELLREGRRVGGYTLRQRLGEGGHGRGVARATFAVGTPLRRQTDSASRHAGRRQDACNAGAAVPA